MRTRKKQPQHALNLRSESALKRRAAKQVYIKRTAREIQILELEAIVDKAFNGLTS